MDFTGVNVKVKIADIIYKNGIPELVNTKIIISYKDSSAYVRLETQDFDRRMIMN